MVDRIQHAEQEERRPATKHRRRILRGEAGDHPAVPERGLHLHEDLAKLRPRLEDERISWRSFWNGPRGTGGPISAAWNVSGWPTVYVIDHEGIIRHKSHGGPAMDAAIQECVTRAEAAR